MFWDKAYTPSANLEELLEKKDATVEEFLDLDDILQECKAQRRNIVNYFTRPDVIKRLIELCITEPPENDNFCQRFKYANMACEILTFGLPSVDETIVEDTELLHILYSYLENEPPLNPLLSSFFSKTINMLFTKKPEKDWFLYQKTCLQLLEYLKARHNYLDLILRHFSTPVIPDLLMHMLRELKGAPLKRSLYEWLAKSKLIERLISILGNPEESDKHRNIADFLCELILSGREMRQSEQDNDSFEIAFAGSNPLLEVIENESTIQLLCDVITQPNAKESTIISGIYIVLTLIEEYLVKDFSTERAQFNLDKEKETHKIVLATIINVFSPKLNEFHMFLINPPTSHTIKTSTGELSPPFGQTRLQVCRLFKVLLRTGNEDITKAISETDFMMTLLNFFKQYCWNNFLHEEVEKCLEHIFASSHYLLGGGSNGSGMNCIGIGESCNLSSEYNIGIEADQNFNNDIKNHYRIDEGGDNLKVNSSEKEVTPLQEYVIVKCKLVSQLIDFWMYNVKMQSEERGRRLGYMGHLIKIFDHIVICIAESQELGALIQNNLNETEKENWNLITNAENGQFTLAKVTQDRYLANCNANESSDCNSSLPRENISDAFLVNLPPFSFSNDFMLETEKLFEAIGEQMFSSTFPLDLRLLNISGNLDDDDDAMNDDDDNKGTTELFRFRSNSQTELHHHHNAHNQPNSLSINVNPWDSNSANDPAATSNSTTNSTSDPFMDHPPKSGPSTSNNGGEGVDAWNIHKFDNFADFDSHFSKDIDDDEDEENTEDKDNSCEQITTNIENSDKNANIEKSFDSIETDSTVCSNDDTLDLDQSEPDSVFTILNGTCEDTELDHMDEPMSSSAKDDLKPTLKAEENTSSMETIVVENCLNKHEKTTEDIKILNIENINALKTEAGVTTPEDSLKNELD